jgi:hypothetical protein
MGERSVTTVIVDDEPQVIAIRRYPAGALPGCALLRPRSRAELQYPLRDI